MALSRTSIVIGAIAVFIAWGYVTDVFPRLLYLPWAFLSGAAFTIGLSLWLLLSTANRPHRAGRDANTITSGSVAFVEPKAWPLERDRLKRWLQYQKIPIYPQSRAISKSADALLDLILRDFIGTWYQHISKRPSFTNEVDKAVRAALSDILSRIADLDIVELLVSRFIPTITKHLHDFDAAERDVRGKKTSHSLTESDELSYAIAGRYNGGKLHTAAALVHSNLKLVQQQYLRGVVARLLPKVLPSTMTRSASVAVLIKEIMACAVLFPILDMLTEPDFWYQQIENYGGSALQERKTVRKLRAALDEHASNPSQSRIEIQFPKLEPGDSERKFEKFVRAIRRLNNLSDARKFRSEVATQLRRDADIEGQDALYLRRLDAAKRQLDQRIAAMATAGSGRGKRTENISNGQAKLDSRWIDAPLREVLYSAPGLSCFMEYMDRQHLMRLVQFWIVVDGIRNPLDADDSNTDPATNFTESDRNDMIQINDAYMSLPEVGATDAVKELVQKFARAGSYATPQEYHAARRAILKTQAAAYETMQQRHYESFKRSDLYYKWLASDDAALRDVPARMERTDSLTHKTSTATPRGSVPPRVPTSILKSSTRNNDLRRAVTSSSDLKAFVKAAGSESPVRRSFDETRQRVPLFDDEDDADPLARSTASLDSEPELRRSLEKDKSMVSAVETALNDIIRAQPDKTALNDDTNTQMLEERELDAASTEIKYSSESMNQPVHRPNLATFGLVGAPRAGGFLDESLFGQEDKFPEDDRADSDVNDKSDEDGIVEAAPGDLGLSEAIDALTLDIEKLLTQESVVDSLTNKAELTNNAAELRILAKSKASLQREINRKELQRQQYIIQESDNSLYGRATVSIQSIMVGQGNDGKEFALYVIEVRRQAGDQMPAAAWVVARRYSEFHELNKRLRSRYPVVRSMDFPRRQVVLKLQKDFLQKRKTALERYLRELLRVPAICRSRELRAFLSQETINPVDTNDPAQVDQRDFVTRIYNSVTDGMEEFLGNIPVLDQLSLAGQNLISAATTQLNQAPSSLTAMPHPLSSHSATGGAAKGTADALGAFGGDLTTAAEAEAELRAFEGRELGQEPFVKPIADLFLEAFELNRESNWLRGRAVVVVLHQLLGGTIERRVRDMGKQHLSEESIVKYLDLARDLIWPDGKLRATGKERTRAEREGTRKDATAALATLVPELVGSVVGRNNASNASRNIIAVLGNKRLNAHLVFTMLDEIINVVFDEQ